jgi:hypothetical protein
LQASVVEIYVNEERIRKKERHKRKKGTQKNSYHCKQTEKSINMFSDDIVSLATHLDKQSKILILRSAHDVGHVGRKNEWRSITLECQKHLSIAKKFSEIDMK